MQQADEFQQLGDLLIRMITDKESYAPGEEFHAAMGDIVDSLRAGSEMAVKVSQLTPLLLEIYAYVSANYYSDAKAGPLFDKVKAALAIIDLPKSGFLVS